MTESLADVQVWSCGGGTQSGAIAVLIGMGKLPKPDICFMTDTGREKSGYELGCILLAGLAILLILVLTLKP